MVTTLAGSGSVGRPLNLDCIKLGKMDSGLSSLESSTSSFASSTEMIIPSSASSGSSIASVTESNSSSGACSETSIASLTESDNYSSASSDLEYTVIDNIHNIMKSKSDEALTTSKCKLDRENVKFSVKGPIPIPLDYKEHFYPGASALDDTPSEFIQTTKRVIRYMGLLSRQCRKKLLAQFDAFKEKVKGYQAQPNSDLCDEDEETESRRYTL